MTFSRFLLVAAMACSTMRGASAQGVQVNVSKENRTIAITTSDQAEALADLAIVNVGFITFGADQDQTYADGSRISNAIAKALSSAGVKPSAIQSAEQNINAIDDNDKVRYAKGIRFRFSQSWRVTVPATAAADTLHAAVLAGANDSGNIQWDLAKGDALEADAAEKALSHARLIAERMADGLHIKLGDLVYASNQTPPRDGVGPRMFSMQAPSAAKARADLKPLAISPEMITRTATVYAVFAIQ